MNICVTGGAGFIGSHIVDRLIALGHKVVVVDNLSTGCREFVNSRAEFLELDIRSKKLSDVFRDFKIEYVFHEAAQTMVDISMGDPVYDADVNIMGLINVLESCRQNKVKKILMPSSAAIYGDITELPLTENIQGQPTSFYGLSKLTGEYYLDLYHKTFNLPYICYRYSNVYGPRQGNGGEGGVVSIFCKQIVEDKELKIFGDGEQTRDFIYVDDVVDANMAGLEHSDVIGTYNVSTGQELSVNELVRTLCDISQKALNVNYGKPRPGDIKNSCLSNELCLKILQWQAKTNFKDGLTKTYEYFVKNKSCI